MDKKRIPSAIPIYGAAAVWLVILAAAVALSLLL